MMGIITLLSAKEAMASPQDRRNILLLALAVLLSWGVAMGFGNIKLGEMPQFVPLQIAGVLILNSLTGILLLGQFVHRRSYLYLGLACAYFFVGFISIPFLLASPGPLTAGWQILGSSQTSIWLWQAWHNLFPLLLIGALCLHGTTRDRVPPWTSTQLPMQIGLALTLSLVVGLTLLFTLGHDYLPIMVVRWQPYHLTNTFYLLATCAAAFTLMALSLTWKNAWRGSFLHLWLFVALVAFLCDIASSMITYERYTLGWYTGRMERLLSASVLLLVFLSEINILPRQFGKTLDGATRDLKLQLRFREQVIESAPNAMVMIDASGKIRMVNRQAEQIFGYARNELLGQLVENLLPERYRSAHPDMRTAFFAKPKTRAMGAGRDLFARRKDGSEVPVEIGLNPIETEEGMMVLSAIVDISERVRSTRALEKSNRELELALAERQQLQQRFERVVEAAPNAMVMINSAGKIEMVNGQAEQIFGYTRSELLGHAVEMLLPDRYRTVHPGMRSSFFNSPTPRAMGAGRDLFARRKDGSEFPVEIGLNPIETEDGTMVLSAIVDITERRRINELQEHLAAIVNSSVDAIISETFGGVITSWNQGAERLFGYSAEEMIGQSITKLFPNDRLDEEKKLIEQLEHGESVNQFKTKRICKDGRVIDVSLTLSPLLNRDGEITGITKIASDITRSRLLEEQLLSHAHDLERSNRELDTFAYVASHDLKSPLRGISQLASWLEEDIPEPDAQTLKHLALMRSRIARMERLLDDLLGYSRVGRVANSVSVVDCAALAREIFALITPPAGFQLNLTKDLPTFPTFAAPFEQILRNLFSNAVKHHDRQDGQITFSARVAGDRYVFSVMDDGPGIPPQFHERVFVMFQTLRPRDEVEGSGMGLALVKKLVETHGGQIILKSNGTRNTCFEFTWPMASELREVSYA